MCCINGHYKVILFRVNTVLNVSKDIWLSGYLKDTVYCYINLRYFMHRLYAIICHHMSAIQSLRKGTVKKNSLKFWTLRKTLIKAENFYASVAN